jgi:DNA transformation protein
VQHVIDLMQRFAVVRARAMFGGHGLYRDDAMFALLAKGELYFKVDEQSVSYFEMRDLHPFTFTAKGRKVRLSYWQAPPETLENEAEMADWCQLAWQAALRARAAAGRRRGLLR